MSDAERAMSNDELERLLLRLVNLRRFQTRLVTAARRLIVAGKPWPRDEVARALVAIRAEAWNIAGRLYWAGLTDAAFDAICGWTALRTTP